MPLWGYKTKDPIVPEALENMRPNHSLSPGRKLSMTVDFLEKNYASRLHEHPTEGRENPFEVLVACILSQRTRDENTDRAVAALFAVARTPEAILALPPRRLRNLIRVSGPYKQKAKKIRGACKDVLEKFGGRVPQTRDELMGIYGIGPKCADIVLMYGHGIPSIAIDTHCNRVPKRIGIVDEDASLAEVKRFLEASVPKEKWYFINTGLVKFGREICQPVHPKCPICPLKKICNYYKDVYSKKHSLAP